ncbi:MAG: lipoprotein [Bacteroidetes bacterium]|nr:lipoprotein [Bacteroidota bacterium]
MRKTIIIILTTLTLSSCNYEYKLCDCNSADEK